MAGENDKDAGVMAGDGGAASGAEDGSKAGSGATGGDNSGGGGQTKKEPAGSGDAGDKNVQMSRDALDSLLDKIRSDEKGKLRGKLEELETFKTSNEAKAKKLEDELAAARKTLDELRSGGKSGEDSIVEELKQLRAQNDLLQKGIEQVAEDAAKQLQGMRLETERAKIVTELGIKFPEMVSGDSIESIRASAEVIAQREKAMREEAAAAAKEAAKKELEAQYAAHLPRPISPDGSLGGGTGETVLTAKRVDEIIRKPDDEFKKLKAELLAKAKKKVGMA
jgi:hypothetical protein